VNAEELDRVYAALAQALTRVPAPAIEMFLARLALLLIVAADDPDAVALAIADAEADLPGVPLVTKSSPSQGGS
jgi:hypothetical protein